MMNLRDSLQKLRLAGYKITKARRLVLSVLHESGAHLTSADVLTEVEARDPSVGRATVFRTLETLTGLAIIRPTYLNPRTPTYVLMSQEGHHSHIVCTRCERVIEIDDCYVDGLTRELEARYDVDLTSHLLEFYGACADCRPADRGQGDQSPG